MAWARKERPEVLIAGAGPVGLFTALELHREGVHVQIVEEEFQAAGHSYALALHADSLVLCDELGLLPAILEQAYPVNRLALYDGDERHLELDLSTPEELPFLAVIPQNVLEQILCEALAAEGIAVNWNHRLARFDEGPDQVRAVVDKLVKDSVGYAVTRTEWLVGSSKEIDVPFVVGADGHRSLVRRQLGIPFPEVGPPQHFAVFEFESDAAPEHEVRIVLDDHTTSVLWPLGDGRCRFSFEMPQPVATAESRTKDRFVFQLGPGTYPALETEQLQDLLARRAPWFRGSIDDVYWRMLVRFERRLAESFGSKHLWLVGDAGHTTGPVGIQSLNVGLREGAELAATLARNLRGNGSLEELETYGQGRLAEWRQLLGIAGGLAAKDETDPWLRSRADRLLACLPASRQRLHELADRLGLNLWSPALAVQHHA